MINHTPPVFTDEEFRKASRSSPNQNCVTIARRDGVVEVRDDKLKGTPYYERLALRLPEAEFDRFQAAVREGENLTGQHLIVTERPDGDTEFRVANSDTVLAFDPAEIAAFYDGVAKREFDTALISA